MNEVLLGQTDRLDTLRDRARHVAWSVAAQLGLHGLCTWELEPRWLYLPKVEMELAEPAPAFAGARVAHLSDIHMSPFMLERHLEMHVEIVNGFEPDFVAITGDFITTSTRHYADRVARVLGRLRPKVASVACLGNHDYGLWHPHSSSESRGLAESLVARLGDHGVECLHNESRTYERGGSRVTFAGVADLWSAAYDPVAAFDGVERDHPIVGLVHNPDAVNDLVACGARYVLAGHTHGKAASDGPLSTMLFPTRHRHYVAGQYYLGDRRHIYVNRGLGNSRRRGWNERPEITVLTMKPAPAGADRAPAGTPWNESRRRHAYA